MKLKLCILFLIMFLCLQLAASIVLIPTSLGAIEEEQCEYCGAKKTIRDTRLVYYHWFGFKTSDIASVTESCSHKWRWVRGYHFDGYIPLGYFFLIKASLFSLLLFLLFGIYLSLSWRKRPSNDPGEGLKEPSLQDGINKEK